MSELNFVSSSFSLDLNLDLRDKYDKNDWGARGNKN